MMVSKGQTQDIELIISTWSAPSIMSNGLAGSLALKGPAQRSADLDLGEFRSAPAT